MRRPLLLDLFSGAGGAAVGYHRAGFDVVGVDIKPQPKYPFEFVCDDALNLLRGGFHCESRWSLDDFDAIHASPPCQAYSALRTIWNNAGKHPELVEPVRDLLNQTGLPWVMENVPGAPVEASVLLCGSMFGLNTGEWELRRHRRFELSGFSCLSPPCQHARDRRRVLGVYGHSGGDHDKTHQGQKATIAEARKIMGIDWMTTAEISQAIPPAYAEHIGSYLLAEVQRRAEIAA